MTKPEARLELMAHWTQAWTTLGRWQALNARLSKEIPSGISHWERRSPGIFIARVASARVSTSPGRP